MLTNVRSVKWKNYVENMEIDLTAVDSVRSFLIS